MKNPKDPPLSPFAPWPGDEVIETTENFTWNGIPMVVTKRKIFRKVVSYTVVSPDDATPPAPVG
jgi:hypothetical protein